MTLLKTNEEILEDLKGKVTKFREELEQLLEKHKPSAFVGMVLFDEKVYLPPTVEGGEPISATSNAAAPSAYGHAWLQAVLAQKLAQEAKHQVGLR